MITLDAEHRYFNGTQRVPGTNEVLDLYFPPSPFYTEEGRDKGSARHQWFHALAQGLEIENAPDPRIAGEVEAFRQFLAEVKPIWHGGEKAFFDSKLHVAGTPDFYGEVFGRLAIVDYKPWNKAKRTQLQTASYKLNLMSNGIRILDRYELRLGAGKYRLEKHEDRSNEDHWRTMVAAWHAKGFYI